MADILNKTDRDAGVAGRIGIWRRAAGAGRHRRIRLVEECCRVAIHEVDQVLPRPDECQRNTRGCTRVFQAIYPALKPIYGLSVVRTQTSHSRFRSISRSLSAARNTAPSRADRLPFDRSLRRRESSPESSCESHDDRARMDR